MRAFVAISMSPEVSDAMVRLQRRLGFGRAVPEDNLHLTLAFLDDQPEDLLEELHGHLAGLRCAPFSLSFTGLGVFGSAVHVPANDSANLTTLHGRVLGTCRKAGITLARRRFRPHVTVARLGKGQTPPPLRAELADFQIPDMEVQQVTLFESTLHPKGARHDPLAIYPLRA
ncbi:RNA 2',3'-cyclic phosphodiesterase [Aliisedimentitalea scapharcae]|uniref:RNA 2',3'-cyclic phosphodiesterase n=1 Tax=Aliisedimentitalea scapharcae TaxID=1524259 RepID=A0ABZ2XX04_9RHOB